ncbi:MAG: ABC transporter substrate-binding protein [Candidatus Tectomicrobia bacterium]|uniref:ABC transporter substrate-binding protein n=1 Tax=Tectimicrobiota bacterium TaxID=2528274 RepID=A0A932HZK2_UNCTE|nr:ABC transporter substrate-binding protein [Candidatus Tectomicrobia bacterium]
MKARLALIAAALLLLGAAPGAHAAKRGGTLRVAMEGDTTDLDVVKVGWPLKVYRESLGTGLMSVNENFEFTGDLARSWELSDEGRVLTLRLHPGGTYHDGAPLDAESVKWNFGLVTGEVVPKWLQEARKKNPKAQIPNSFKAYLSHVQKVEVVDKYTLRIHQKDIGKAQTFEALAATFTRFVLVSPKAYDMDIEKFSRSPVLSGPFKFVEWKRNQHLFAERHKGYFDKNLPYVDRIEFYFMPDANQRMNALTSGQIDIINNLPLSLYETAKKAPGVRTYLGRTTTNYAFPYNVQLPMWKDIRVRKAISCYGVDRAGIAKTALRGLGQPWNSVSPPGAVDALDLTKECPYDPEKARKLLAEAGYGPAKPFKFTMTTNNSDPAHLEVAQALKSQFARIGADMDIRVVDYATWNRAFVVQRRLEITLQNTLSSLTVNTNSHVFYSKSGLDYYNIKDPKLDGLVEAWRSTIDPRRQIEASHRIQRYMAEMAYYPAIAGFPFIQASRADVKGFHYLGKLMNDFRGVWLDR